MEPEPRKPGTDSRWVRAKEQIRGMLNKIRDQLEHFRFFLIPALIASVLYGLVLCHQAQESSNEARYQMWATQTVVWGKEEAMLSIAYPRELRLESPVELRPISIWLWKATPTKGPTPTPTLTLTPTIVLTGTPPPTPTPTCTPPPWIVAFSPHDGGILFTNQEGVPIAPQVALTPGAESAAPAVLYAQRAPLATKVSTTTLKVSVYGPGSASVPASPLALSVDLESAKNAGWRHFRGLVLGPTTPLLVFAVSLVVFAVEEWRLGRERAQKRQEEKLARVGELRALSNNIVQAAERYRDYRIKTGVEPGWRDPDLRERLDDTWRSLFSEDTLQSSAARQLAQKNFSAAKMLSELALEYDPEGALSQALLKMSKLGSSLATQTGQGGSVLAVEEPGEKEVTAGKEETKSLDLNQPQAERAEREGHKTTAEEPDDGVAAAQLGTESSVSVEAAIQACLTVDREYVDHAEIEGVRKTVVELLAKLICQGHLQSVEQELSVYKYGPALLGEPEFEKPLRERKREESAQRLRALGWKTSRWLEPWPENPIDMDKSVASWLQMVGLKFNPFGPEAAELDPHLKDYGVESVFGHVRGRKPVLVFGPPGSGKTAASLLLTWYCGEPPERPREVGAFPARYTLPTDIRRDGAQCAHLATIARTVAPTVARCLANRPDSFLRLPPPRKHSVVQLLSLWASSSEHLEAGLKRLGPEWGTSSRLIHAVTALYQKVSHEEMTEQEYLDLLASARLAGFECIYLLVDLPNTTTGPRALVTAQALRPLLDLTIPLAARGVYLKGFLPDDLRRYLGYLTACEVTSLTWSAKDLTKMLESRFQITGGNSLAALCVPPDPDIDRRLVEAANGSPRQLVRAGNALLEEHVRRSGEPQFSAEWAVSFLQKWGGNNG